MSHVELGPQFSYKMAPSPLFEDLVFRQLNLSGYGREILNGFVEFNILKREYPQIKILVIPVLPGLAFSLFTHLYFRLFQLPSKPKIRTPLSLFVDWPSSFQTAKTEIINSFPSPAIIEAQQLSRRTEHWFLDPLEPRRSFLAGASRSASLDIKHVSFIGNERTTEQSEHLFLSLNAPNWVETLQPQGLLPYLSLAFHDAPIETVDESSSLELLKRISNAPNDCHVVMGTPGFLNGLADRLEKSLTPHLAMQQDPTQFRNTLSFRKKDAGETKVNKLPAKTAAELSAIPFFLAKDVFEAPLEVISDAWPSLAANSLVTAFRKAEQRYFQWTKMSVTKAQEQNFFRFANRLALHSQRLFPKTFDILLAAQSCIDSNFSFELLKECYDCPQNATFEARASEAKLDLHALGIRMESFSIERFATVQSQRIARPKIRNLKKSSLELKMNPGLDESKYPDDSWAHENLPYSCSFPEEDIFMEDYAFQCRDRAKDLLKTKDTLTREMSASLADGIDIRETARNFHLGKIMVKEELALGKADIGSVIFQFVPHESEENHSWVSYWLAEKHDKSDLMFYATPYANEVIGPGIARSEFGGFAVIPLPNYLDNPWAHPYIKYFSRSLADALLVAAAMATDHKTILHIGVTAPSAEISSLLKRSGKFLIHVPLDEIPVDKLRRIRTFHILAESGVRSWAEKYIRKEY
jgi:hypothetical protein